MEKPNHARRSSAPALAVLASATRATRLAAFQRDMSAAQERLDRLAAWTASPGGLVSTPAGEVLVAVRGEGFPVLVMHGAAGGFDRALDIGEQHLGPGFQVIAPSRYGYPGSPIPPAATPLSQATAFSAVLDHLDVDRVAVIAHSAGGVAAVQLALRDPDRIAALVLVATTVTERKLRLPNKPLLQAIIRSDLIYWMLSGPLRRPGRNLYLQRDYALSAYETAELAEAMSGSLPIRPRRDGILFDMYVTNPDPILHPDAYRLEDLDVPTLLVNARDDPLIDYAHAHAMAGRIPGARLVTVPTGGHVMLGHRGLIRAEIDRFIEAWA